MTEDNDSEALWQEEFAPIRATILDPLQQAVLGCGFLEPPNQDVELERHRGLFASRLAVNFDNKVLETFGMIDEAGPHVLPSAFKLSIRANWRSLQILVS